MTLSHYNRCFECNEELSTHCNKKALAQTLDFLQKHAVKATSGKVFILEAWHRTKAFIRHMRPNCNFSKAEVNSFGVLYRHFYNLATFSVEVGNDCP